MDIELPALDGYQTTAKIRQLGGWAQSCPIIAFTSLRPEEGVSHFRAKGMDDYIAKPFAVAEIIQLIDRWTKPADAKSAQTDPQTRLAALIGEAEAEAMIARFHERLKLAVTEIDQGGDIASFAHRLGGLAGILGFEDLSHAWLGLQDGDYTTLPAVLSLTRKALETYRNP